MGLLPRAEVVMQLYINVVLTFPLLMTHVWSGSHSQAQSTIPSTSPSHLPQLSSPQIPQSHSLQHRQPGIMALHWRFGFAFHEITIIAASTIALLGTLTLITAWYIRILSQITDNCLNLWASLPPANQVVIEAGDLRLEFGCAMEPVPWEFVAEYAESKSDAVRRGFAPVMQREWWFHNGDAKRVCYAGLRSVPRGGHAVRPGQGNMTSGTG